MDNPTAILDDLDLPRRPSAPPVTADQRPSVSYDRKKKLKRLEWLSGRPRSLTKTGENTLRAINIPSQKRKFMADMFTSLLEIKWRWILFTFCLLYFFSWLVFAVGWYTILHFHGDLENFANTSWTPCVSGIRGFTHAFLFSVETQHTIGYGHYYIGDECQLAIILMCLQAITGVMLEGFLVGLIFTKMSRAKKRSATLMFSKRAVICRRDGQLYFMFRVADMRTTCPLLDAKVRAQFVKKRLTQEGEEINYYLEDLVVQGDSGRDGRILLLWPTIIVHKIDALSPLRHLTPADLNLRNSSFEIIVVLEGIVEATGNPVQVRSSYLPSEILWNQKLASLESDKVEGEERVIDYLLFHNTASGAKGLDDPEDTLQSVHISSTRPRTPSQVSHDRGTQHQFHL